MTWDSQLAARCQRQKDWLICSTGILAWLPSLWRLGWALQVQELQAGPWPPPKLPVERCSVLSLETDLPCCCLEMHPHCLVLHGMALHGNGMDQVSQTIQDSHELCAVQLSTSGTCCVYIPKWSQTGTAPSYIVYLCVHAFSPRCTFYK